MTSGQRELRSKITSLIIRGASRDVVTRMLDVDSEDEQLNQQISAEFDALASLLSDRERRTRVAAEKALWMMSVYRRLSRYAETAIDCRENLSPDEFFSVYYYNNKPLILRGFASRWQSFDSWRIDALVNRFGDEDVEVMTRRNAVTDFDREVDKTKETMRFSQFVSKLMAAQGVETNDFYMVARNLNLRKAFGSIVKELKPLPGILTEHRSDFLNLWIGPAGTVTKLHHDLSNVLFCQLSGSKRVHLVAPCETELVYNIHGVIADVDAENPDYKAHPLFADARVLTIDLNAGDAMFIPVGWWHQIRSLSESISLTFINFASDNFFNLSNQTHLLDSKA